MTDRKLSSVEPASVVGARERGKETRRARVLDAAEVLIRRRGEVAFSMRELAENAQLSLATPFNLFGSKSAVLTALVERKVESQLERLMAAHEGDPIARVLALAERAVHTYTTDWRLYRPVLRSLLAVIDASGPRLVRKCTELWREALRDAEDAGLLDAGFDIDLLARQLHLEYRAGMSLWLSGETDDLGWLLQVRHGVALVLLGAVAPSSRPSLRATVRETQAALADTARRPATKRNAVGTRKNR